MKNIPRIPGFHYSQIKWSEYLGLPLNWSDIWNTVHNPLDTKKTISIIWQQMLLISVYNTHIMNCILPIWHVLCAKRLLIGSFTLSWCPPPSHASKESRKKFNSIEKEVGWKPFVCSYDGPLKNFEKFFVFCYMVCRTNYESNDNVNKLFPYSTLPNVIILTHWNSRLGFGEWSIQTSFAPQGFFLPSWAINTYVSHIFTNYPIVFAVSRMTLVNV